MGSLAVAGVSVLHRVTDTDTHASAATAVPSSYAATGISMREPTQGSRGYLWPAPANMSILRVAQRKTSKVFNERLQDLGFSLCSPLCFPRIYRGTV